MFVKAFMVRALVLLPFLKEKFERERYVRRYQKYVTLQHIDVPIGVVADSSRLGLLFVCAHLYVASF